MSFLLGFAPKCRSRATMSGLFCLTASCIGKVWVTHHDPSHFIGICCVKAILCQEAQDIPSVLLPPFSALPKRSCPSCSFLGMWLGSVSWTCHGTLQFWLRTKALVVALTPGCIVWHWETLSQNSMKQKHPTQTARNLTSGFAYTTM